MKFYVFSQKLDPPPGLWLLPRICLSVLCHFAGSGLVVKGLRKESHYLLLDECFALILSYLLRKQLNPFRFLNIKRELFRLRRNDEKKFLEISSTDVKL